MRRRGHDAVAVLVQLEAVHCPASLSRPGSGRLSAISASLIVGLAGRSGIPIQACDVGRTVRCGEAVLDVGREQAHRKALEHDGLGDLGPTLCRGDLFIRIQAGDHIITAADPLPDELRGAIEAINNSR
jgi:hypothetical protein